MWVVALVYTLYCVTALIVCNKATRRRHEATQALDRIQTVLDGNEWGPDTVAAIADAVRDTGREVRDTDEYDLRYA